MLKIMNKYTGEIYATFKLSSLEPPTDKEFKYADRVVKWLNKLKKTDGWEVKRTMEGELNNDKK